MEKSLFQGIDAQTLKLRKKMAQPSFMPPMLATLTDSYFSSNDWIYEHKFDGVRLIAVKKKGKTHLISRNKNIKDNEYPEIVQAFDAQDADNFIVDGEIIAVGKKGVSDFQMLQGRINLKDEIRLGLLQKTMKIKFCIFDVIYAGGYDVRKLPLLARKKILKRLLRYNKLLEYTKHKKGDGLAYFKYACKHHWEGLIAKYSQSEYETGKRSSQWLKFKCVMEQELVIGGFTMPRGSRTDFGALLVGYFKNGKFMFAGKVGTGFSEETLEILGKKLRRLERKSCPFVNYDESTLNVHWVKPELVAEFGFAQWTNSGKLRVGRYKGLRDDKNAKDVVKETPKLIGAKRKK